MSATRQAESRAGFFEAAGFAAAGFETRVFATGFEFRLGKEAPAPENGILYHTCRPHFPETAKRGMKAASRAESASKLVIWCLPAASEIHGGSIADLLFQKRCLETNFAPAVRAKRCSPPPRPAAGGE
jgi:hypothetical protein